MMTITTMANPIATSAGFFFHRGPLFGRLFLSESLIQPIMVGARRRQLKRTSSRHVSP